MRAALSNPAPECLQVLGFLNRRVAQAASRLSSVPSRRRTISSLQAQAQAQAEAGGSMLAKAKKSFEANPPPPPPLGRNSLAKQPFPSCSPSDIREQFKKPGHGSATSAPAPAPAPAPSLMAGARPAAGIGQGSIASLYARTDEASSFRHDAVVIDLTGADAPARAKLVVEDVDFFEDDFSDDGDLDLDFKAPFSHAASSHPMPSLPALPRQDSEPTSMASPPRDPRSEAQMSWATSSPSHLMPPPAAPPPLASATEAKTNSLKRDSFDIDTERKAKKRVLPPSFRSGNSAEVRATSTPTPTPTPLAAKPKIWDASASTIQEQKRQFKTQRQLEAPGAPSAATEHPPRGAAQEFGRSSKTSKKEAISLSSEQEHVLDLVVNQRKSVFFTGPAGTGKSVLMRAIINKLREKHAKDPEKVAVTASTGLAACNIGGITLHSFAGIGLGKEEASVLLKKVRQNPKAKQKWLRTQCLIIDEISMVDGDLFDKLSQIGRTIRNNGRPWGGIQLILTGDFFQLPPVPDQTNQNQNRSIKFSFEAATWGVSIDHTIGLTQVFRQRDPVFASMLNEIRLGKISQSTVAAFRALSRPLQFDDGVESAELYPTRAQVEASNLRRLRELPGKVYRFESLDTGDKNVKDRLLANMMAPKSIDLKVNSQVMLIKNLDETLVNGTLGKVTGFADVKTWEMETADSMDPDMMDATAKAREKLMAYSHDEGGGGSGTSTQQKWPLVQFMATNGVYRTILCEPEEFTVQLPNGEVQAKRSQVPLILAWALSIHKAQGQTLERVTVDLGKVFENGQAYVALSRATTQQGLRVLGFDRSKVMAHPRVITFYQQLYSAQEASEGRPSTLADVIAAPRKVSKAPPAAAAAAAAAKTKQKQQKQQRQQQRQRQRSIDGEEDIDADAEAAMASFGY